MMTSLKRSAAPFATGLLVGVVLSFCAGRYMHRPFRDMEKMRHHMLEKFSRKLDLTPDQKAKVGDILKQNGDRMKALWDDMRPKAEEVRNSTKTQIRALLTPEQQKKFDVFQEKMEKRWKHRPEGPGGPDGPPPGP